MSFQKGKSLWHAVCGCMCVCSCVWVAVWNEARTCCRSNKVSRHPRCGILAVWITAAAAAKSTATTTTRRSNCRWAATTATATARRKLSGWRRQRERAGKRQAKQAPQQQATKFISPHNLTTFRRSNHSAEQHGTPKDSGWRWPQHRRRPSCPAPAPAPSPLPLYHYLSFGFRLWVSACDIRLAAEKYV